MISIIFFSLITALSTQPLEAKKNHDTKKPGWIVRLATPSIAKSHEASGSKEVQKIIGELAKVLRSSPSCKIEKIFSKSVQAIILNSNCPLETLDEIRNMPGIQSVVKEGMSFPLLEVARPQVAAPLAYTVMDPQGVPLSGRGIRVGIIDTGIDYNHPLLGGCYGPSCRVVGGYDFYSQDSDPLDESGHGTHVASIAAGSGVYPGLAPEVTLYALKIFGPTGGTAFSVVVEAIEWAMDPNNDNDFSDHLDVVNLSLGADCRSIGAYSDECGPNDIQSVAVDAAFSVGVNLSISAGNSGSYGRIGSPGVARSAITVGAINGNNSLASFSSLGPAVGFPEIFKPDLVAPGDPICAAKSNLYRIPFSACGASTGLPMTNLNGTSMSAPVVTGIIALLKQARPSWTPSQIKATLQATSDSLNLPFHKQGFGRINAHRAVTASEPLEVHLSTMGHPLGQFAAIGRASGSGFISWELSMGSGQTPETWTPLTSSTSPIETESVLSDLNLNGLSDGFYSLRLRALHASGLVYTAHTGFELDHLKITTPREKEEFRSSQITISGTAAGPGFNSYDVRLYTGANPPLEAAPIAAVTGLNVPVLASALTRFDMSAHAPGYYTIRVTMRYYGQNGTTIEESESKCFVYEPDLKPNFSKTYYLGFSYSSVKPVRNFSGDYDVAFQIPWVVTTPNPPTRTVFRLTPSSQDQLGYPFVPVNALMDTTFASGDLNGDGSDELIVLDRQSTASIGDLCIAARKNDASVLWNTCLPSSSTYPWKALVANIDNEPNLEVVVMNNRRLIPGQPLQTEVVALANTGIPRILATIPNSITQSAAIGDLDNDSFPEIVIVAQPLGATANSAQLIVIDPRASAIERQINLPFRQGSTMALGILRPNEARSIILASLGGPDAEGNYIPPKVWVYDSTLNLRSGWPRILDATASGDDKNWGPSLGDIDGDRWPEILLTAPPTGLVYAFKPDGTVVPSFPLLTGQSVGGQVVVADLNQDLRGDLIFGSIYSDSEVLDAYSGTGTRIPGFPKQLTAKICDMPHATPFVGDIDGDSVVELISRSQGSVLSDPDEVACGPMINQMRVKGWELELSVRPESIQWGQFQFDSGNSGCFDCQSEPSYCPTDFNRSGETTVEDLFGFLGAIFAGDPRADFDRSGEVSTQDIFSYLQAFFSGAC